MKIYVIDEQLFSVWSCIYALGNSMTLGHTAIKLDQTEPLITDN